LKRFLPALAAVLFFSPAQAADDTGPSLGSIVAASAERTIPAGPASQTPAGLIASLAGVGTLPVGCASPIVAALVRPSGPSATTRPAASPLASRPALPAERQVSTSDGRFTMHFSEPSSAIDPRAADRDGNTLPDSIDRFGEALGAARSFLVDRLGYPPPSPEDRPLDVYLLPLGHGLEGYVVPAPVQGSGPGGAAFLVLDADLGSDRVMPAVVHQIAHASLLGFGARGVAWWSEASAGFLAYAATGDTQGASSGIRARMQSPGRGLAADELLLMQGAILWPLFLSERTGGPLVVRQIWSDMGARGLDPLSAADQVMKRTAGLQLADLFREYALWNLFTGSRDDGRHYPAGRSLPEESLPVIGPVLPVSLDPIEPVEPMGSVAVRLPGDHGKGALDLIIQADGGSPAADLLVLAGEEADRPILVPVPLDPNGNGRLSIPWAGTHEIWIVLRNGDSPTSAGFRIQGSRDPFAPFDLASFAADGIGSTITLTWTTASETGMAGWNIYRSESPSGPFSRLNDVALPAFGDGTAETGYVYLDDTARPGRRYYYLLEGLTNRGLADRSHVVSGRAPGVRG
jgi:hypothetical protein